MVLGEYREGHRNDSLAVVRTIAKLLFSVQMWGPGWLPGSSFNSLDEVKESRWLWGASGHGQTSLDPVPGGKTGAENGLENECICTPQLSSCPRRRRASVSGVI